MNNIEELKRVWFQRLEQISPRQPNEHYSFHAFETSPMVKSCLEAMAAIDNGSRHKLTLIETNLSTIHEMGKDCLIPVNMVEHIIRMVKELQK